jgi:putative hemin transport protein
MMQNSAVKDRLEAYRVENPQARLVDIAKNLNITELEALHCQVDDQTVFALRTDWQTLFASLPNLGPVMALTRNEYVVHECKGQYAPASWQGPMGLVHSPTIDLRMFSSRWAYLYAVQVKNPRGLLHSFQIFDACGRAVHKIFLEPGGKLDVYHQILQALKRERFELPRLAALALPEAPRPIDSHAIELFRKDWAALQDTHDFFGMLRKHKLPRLQALEIAGADFACELDRNAVARLLELAQKEGEALMAFVGNPGMIQIYSGKVQQTRRVGDWMNVLDPGFNLHIHENGIDRVFVVHKPTRHGLISSLEVFSARGDLILSLFGYRKDDQQQTPSWGRLLSSLSAS